MDVFLLRTLGPAAVLSTLVLGALVGAPVILYAIARWRAHREGSPDTQLGLKFALHYFAISAFQLGLAGAALLIYMLISPGTADKGDGYRAAMGLLLPAALVLAVHWQLLKRTNDEAYPGVRRLFWGYNLIVTGLVAFFALVFGFQMLFAKGSTHGLGHLAGSMLVVYGAAWAVVGYKFGQLVLGGGASSGHGGGYPMPVPMQAPPAPAPAPPTTSTQPGLPALGGGSFPPIDDPPR